MDLKNDLPHANDVWCKWCISQNVIYNLKMNHK